MPAVRINHVSVHATDLEASTAFYVDLLGLEPIPTPTFGFPVQWLRVGDQQVHLFEREGATAPRYHHLGIDVDDFEAVYRRVGMQQLADGRAFFAPLSVLPDGAVQLYVRDPADNLVELNWPDASTLSPAIRRQARRLENVVPQAWSGSTPTLYSRADGA